MIVATAGHVDHGKTSLVRQLTGVETDRLEEEKRRGLSINLGYAYQPLSGASPLGFIDVPGHRRFINTMIAGVSGIDIGLLVVAADDGPMPQTLEHLDVLRLLGVPRKILVISKIDRVDSARVEEVKRQMQTLLSADNELSVPVFALSNVDGTGVEALKTFLHHQAREQEAASAEGCFRLSIDRAFNLKGQGLVVTGTVAAGMLHVGDSLRLLPQNKKLRVRGLHTQGQESGNAGAGQRCAINLVGDIDKNAIERGDWLVGLEAGPVTRRLDARLTLLDSAPFALKHLSPIKMHIGAKRVAGRIFLLQSPIDENRLLPGNSALVQLILDSDIACCHGERFLLRDDSESVTLGGGVVLDPYAPQSGKMRGTRLQLLQALEQPSAAAALRQLVTEQLRLLDFALFRKAWNQPEAAADGLVDKSHRRFEADSGDWLVSHTRWRTGREQAMEFLAVWHRENPDEEGISLPLLKNNLSKTLETPLLLAVLTELLQQAEIVLRDGVIKRADHKVSVSSEAIRQWETLAGFLQKRRYDIPLLSEIATEIKLAKSELESMVRLAAKDHRLIKLNNNRYAQPETLLELAQMVTALQGQGEPLTVIAFKARMGTGRKVAIEVLEYFDSIRFTQRRANERVILDAGVPAQRFDG